MKNTKFNISLLILLLFSIFSCSSDGDSTGTPVNSTGNNDGKGGSLAIFALKGDYLYTVDHRDLTIFSLVDKENPIKVGGVVIGFNIETLFSFNEYLFVGSREGMYIYDVTFPENPKRLSQVVHFTACDPVVANETHAFVTLHSNSFCGNNQNALIIYDIKDPTKPVEIGNRKLVMPRGLALYGNYLIVCDDELKIFDITIPEDSRFLKSVAHQYKDVVIYNNTLFAFGENRISQYRWNGSDFANLKLISTLNY